jgi:lipoic acid synthetase
LKIALPPAIKRMDPTITVELLIPDMQGERAALQVVARSGAEIIGHNLETVPRLYAVRKGAKYGRSLQVLKKLGDF